MSDERTVRLTADLRRWIAALFRLPAEEVRADLPLEELRGKLPDPRSLFFAVRLVAERSLGLTLHEVELRRVRDLAELAAYLVRESVPPPPPDGKRFTDPYEGGSWGWRMAPPADPADRLPAAAFILSSARSGSTLLRMMLAGHPDLFSPPELNLLPFESMGSRGEQLDRLGYSWMRYGPGSALANLEGLTPEQTAQRLARLEEEDVAIREVYRQIQEAAGGRLLVDKSPAYSRHPRWLARAEELFHEPLYIVLTRHPLAAIESFVRLRFHRMVADHSLVRDDDPWVLAEKTWAVNNRHILDFIASLPTRRWIRIRYEELVAAPEPVLRRICEFLGIRWNEALLNPYEGDRMTRMPGLPAQSTIGDPNVLTRDRIDPSLAESWRRVDITLSRFTREVAGELGY